MKVYNICVSLLSLTNFTMDTCIDQLNTYSLDEPSCKPTSVPSSLPTMVPSPYPTYVPTIIPTSSPTKIKHHNSHNNSDAIVIVIGTAVPIGFILMCILCYCKYKKKSTNNASDIEQAQPSRSNFDTFITGKNSSDIPIASACPISETSIANVYLFHDKNDKQSNSKWKEAKKKYNNTTINNHKVFFNKIDSDNKEMIDQFQVTKYPAIYMTANGKNTRMSSKHEFDDFFNSELYKKNKE